MALFSAGRSLGYANHPLSQSRREAGGSTPSPDGGQGWLTPADRSSVDQGRPSGCLGASLSDASVMESAAMGTAAKNLRRLLDADPSRLTEPLTKKARLDPSQIEWLPFPRNAQGKEREFQGIAFLAPDMRKGLTEAWREFWPQKGRKPSWEAIARAGDTWFLVEAKANHPEFASPGSRSEGEPRTRSSDRCAASSFRAGTVSPAARASVARRGSGDCIPRATRDVRLRRLNIGGRVGDRLQRRSQHGSDHRQHPDRIRHSRRGRRDHLLGAVCRHARDLSSVGVTGATATGFVIAGAGDWIAISPSVISHPTPT